MLNTVLNFNNCKDIDQQQEQTYRMSECEYHEPKTPILNQIYINKNEQYSS